MRSPWVSIIGAGLCIGLVPACSPLLTQPSSGDPLPSPAAKREQAADPAIPSPPRPAGPKSPPIKPLVNNETLTEPPHFPAGGSSSELIPEPRNPAEMPPAAEVAAPTVQSPPADSHPAKPAVDPPLIEAIRCFMDKRPSEAVACLARCDKSSQELLLCLLPLAVHLADQGGQRQDPRETGAYVDQLERLAYRLHCRAPLRITKMYLCESIQGYGKYQPRPEAHSFRPGELARLYIELQHLSDEAQGNGYSFHLLTNIEIRDFSNNPLWHFKFDDPGPDISLSKRHDFYHLCTFRIPEKTPGFYILYVKIRDAATGREVEQTLDFRISSWQAGE
jgi:hypothetical protein